MAESTRIEWCDHTWNPWIGCAQVSPLCDHCYARDMTKMRGWKATWGKPGAGVGTRVKTKTWDQPRRWNAAAERDGTRPFVFCASLADLFDNHPDVGLWRAEAFQVMRETPKLVYLLLTKRPQNIAKMVEAAGGLPKNVALGASAGIQSEAERTIPLMASLKRDLRPLFTFVSAEPLLAPLDLSGLTGFADLDWLIVGGESGHGARWMDPAWARSLRDQCRTAGVTFNFKQTGTAAEPGSARKTRPNQHDLDGVTYFDRPADSVRPVTFGSVGAFRAALHNESVATDYSTVEFQGGSARQTLRPLILEVLRTEGPLDGPTLRQRVLAKAGLDPTNARHVNFHSWALVDLKAERLVGSNGSTYEALPFQLMVGVQWEAGHGWCVTPMADEAWEAALPDEDDYQDVAEAISDLVPTGRRFDA